MLGKRKKGMLAVLSYKVGRAGPLNEAPTLNVMGKLRRTITVVIKNTNLKFLYGPIFFAHPPTPMRFEDSGAI
jgi:hypothetical protein